MTCRITGLRKPSKIVTTQQDDVQNHWPQETVRDQRKRPRPVLKLFSTHLIRESMYNSSTHTTCVHVQELQYCKPARAACWGMGGGGGGGGACNVGKITLCRKFTEKWGGGGGGCNSEQGITARQFVLHMAAVNVIHYIFVGL